MTGLSRDAAQFQARSAFTGTGFTTTEAENVVNRPVRRRIVMWLMVARSAGLVTIIISLVLSFVGTEGRAARLVHLAWLVGGVICLWGIASSRFVDRHLNRAIEWALRRWTDLDPRDYYSLLNLSEGYNVRKLSIKQNDWLAEKKLKDCRLTAEGVTVLGIYRNDGSYVGAPKADTDISPGDTLILYGRAKILRNLEQRRSGESGEQQHQEAVQEQRQHEARQEQQEREHERKRKA